VISYEQADAVPDDAAKGFVISPLLDVAAAEGRAKPCATAGSKKPIAAP
jgi:hypothetical protein